MLADAEGKVIERVEVHYRQNGLLGDVIQVEGGAHLLKCLSGRGSRATESSALIPPGLYLHNAAW